MHIANVVAAWALTVHDRLQDGMREVQLDSRELAALTLVSTHDGSFPDWLRARVGLTQSGTVRLIDRLAGRGLLRRGTSTGRGVPLHVTPEGDEVLLRWHRTRDGAVTDLLAGIPTDQQHALVVAMEACLIAEDRQRDQADATCRTCSWAACGSDCPVDRSVASP